MNQGPKKICLLTDHHVALNPRVWKEAFFYEKKGYRVVILSMWQAKNILEKDLQILRGHQICYKSFLNLIPGEANKLMCIFYRARKRIAGVLQKTLNISAPWAISYAPEVLLKHALKEDADFYIAHLECAFYVGRDLIKTGKNVSFDFEDWYSRDYLVPERPVALLQSLEKFALINGVFCTAASKAMADALNETYNISTEITVIYNGFSKHESAERMNEPQANSDDHTKIIWFSRTVGPERGIEFLLKALHVCTTPVELHLLGDMSVSYKHFLEINFPYNQGHLLFLHPFMPHNNLLNFLAQFTIGLAIEENINDNKALTVSNKILQYIQAGLIVVASETKGQNEVTSSFPDTVITVDITNPKQFAEAIKTAISKRNFTRQKQLDTFNQIFSWEAQEVKLNSLLERFL